MAITKVNKTKKTLKVSALSFNSRIDDSGPGQAELAIKKAQDLEKLKAQHLPELPVNIGVGKDYSIKELAERIAGIVGYEGRITWDASRPDGAPRKLLDSSRINGLGWRPEIDFEQGIRQTYAWYKEQTPS